jgi:CxxC motif-containing protein (DUF1111 family)
MKSIIVLLTSLATLAIVAVLTTSLRGQLPVKDTRAERFTPQRGIADEGPAGFFYLGGNTSAADQTGATEAPTGFDNRTNGFAKQGPSLETLDEDNVVPTRSFNDGRFVFEEVETAADGLGPTYNAQSCRECHQNVVTGGASQVTEHRTGHTFGEEFFEAPGGSLIQSRATFPDIVERVAREDEIRTFRISTNLLGNGFVECIANSTLVAIRDAQPEDMRGTALLVPVLEGDRSTRVGRFGWKSQHGSLLSFAADAYLNEMGITSPLFPEENTSSGRFVGFGSGYDPLPEPDNDGEDVEGFALFMRSTKAPSRGDINNTVIAGEARFSEIGCAICHVSSIVTARPGRKINGDAFVVPQALGNKIIHPYSDFLLHDIGTGDGIPFLPLPEFAPTAKQIRTAPLWGLRTRNRLMHDGLTFTKKEAIQRHTGQADSVRKNFNALPKSQRDQIMAFLESL